MTYTMIRDVYTTQTRPTPARSTPHPQQHRRRRSFAVPQDAYDPHAPELLRVSIR